MKCDPVIGCANVVDEEAGRRVHVADDGGEAAIVPQIADGEAARRIYRGDAGASVGGDVGESGVAIVVIKDAGFLESAAEMLAVDFGVDVAIDEKKIGPAVVVEIEKHRTPSEIFCVEAKAGGISDVVESSIAVVAIESGGVVGEICFEDVQLAVTVEVGDGRAHAGLSVAVFVEGGASGDGDISESAVAIIVIENAGGAVAGDENVRPAVIVVIESGDAQGVMSIGSIDVGFCADVFESAVAAVVIENVFCGRETLRAAHYGDAFPDAGSAIAGSGCGGEIEVDVVGDY
jgi:hypothetical protein